MAEYSSCKESNNEIINSIRNVPEEVENIIESYLLPEIFFAKFSLLYGPTTMYNYIFELCSAGMKETRNLMGDICPHIRRLKPNYRLRSPFHYMSVPLLNSETRWCLTDDGVDYDRVALNINNCLEEIYSSVYDKSTLSEHRSEIYKEFGKILRCILRRHAALFTND
jgi:hypothetical protein